MILKINGVIAPNEIAPTLQDAVRSLDRTLEVAMNAHPVTEYAHWWVTGFTDDFVRPIVNLGKATVYGAFKLADYTGEAIYEKAFPATMNGASNILHDIVNKTIEHCTKGTGCF